MSNIHLRAAEQENLPPVSAPKTDTASFFVLQAGTFEWTTGTRVVGVYHTLVVAELEARRLKLANPQMHYGVAQLISEARAVKEPVETVRVYPTDDPS
jgi:hypothetical protein